MTHAKRSRGVLCVCLLTAAAALAAFPASAAAQKRNNNQEPELPAPPVVIKFLGSQKMRYQGKEVLMVAGQTAIGGKRVMLAIPNNDNDKYSPNERMEEATRELKPGDYALTETTTKDYKTWLSRFEAYKAREGEEQPNAWIFQDSYPQKNGDREVQVVALYKFGNYVDTVLPMRRDETSKQMITDPDMLATVGKFKKGDVVEAEIKAGRPPTVQSIDPYKPAQQATMGKMTEAEVAEGVKGPAVELDQGGKTVTLPIPGRMAGQKWVPDQKLVGMAKANRPGAAVMVKTREAGGKIFLKEIKPAPKTPVAAKAKEPAMKEKGPAKKRN